MVIVEIADSTGAFVAPSLLFRPGQENVATDVCCDSPVFVAANDLLPGFGPRNDINGMCTGPSQSYEFTKTTIRALAEDCATALIQAIWRGYKVRIVKKVPLKELQKIVVESPDNYLAKTLESTDVCHTTRQKSVQYNTLDHRNMDSATLESKSDEAQCSEAADRVATKFHPVDDIQHKRVDAFTGCNDFLQSKTQDVRKRAGSSLRSDVPAPFKATIKYFAYPDGVNANSPRAEVVATGYKAASKIWLEKDLRIGVVDLVKILNMLGVIAENKCGDLLSNSMAREGAGQYQDFRVNIDSRWGAKHCKSECFGTVKGHRDGFPISLSGPLSDLVQQIVIAVESLFDKKSSKRIQRAVKQAMFRPELVKFARSRLLSSIQLPVVALTLLTQHSAIAQYDRDMARDFLIHLGVDNFQQPTCLSSQSLLGHLRDCKNQAPTAVKKRRLELAISLVEFIGQWEAAVKWELTTLADCRKNASHFTENEYLRSNLIALQSQLSDKFYLVKELSPEMEQLKNKMPTLNALKSNDSSRDENENPKSLQKVAPSNCADQKKSIKINVPSSNRQESIHQNTTLKQKPFCTRYVKEEFNRFGPNQRNNCGIINGSNLHSKGRSSTWKKYDPATVYGNGSFQAKTVQSSNTIKRVDILFDDDLVAGAAKNNDAKRNSSRRGNASIPTKEKWRPTTNGSSEAAAAYTRHRIPQRERLSKQSKVKTRRQPVENQATEDPLSVLGENSHNRHRFVSGNPSLKRAWMNDNRELPSLSTLVEVGTEKRQTSFDAAIHHRKEIDLRNSMCESVHSQLCCNSVLENNERLGKVEEKADGFGFRSLNSWRSSCQGKTVVPVMKSVNAETEDIEHKATSSGDRLNELLERLRVQTR